MRQRLAEESIAFFSCRVCKAKTKRLCNCTQALRCEQQKSYRVRAREPGAVKEKPSRMRTRSSKKGGTSYLKRMESPSERELLRHLCASASGGSFEVFIVSTHSSGWEEEL